MPTLRAAAVLLAAATDLASMAPIAALVGCAGPPAPLDIESRTALGIPEDCDSAHVASGPGTLRALLVTVGGSRPMRDVVTHLARRLSSRAPHALWLAIANRADRAEVAIAAWLPGRSGPRVSALLVDRTHVVDSDAETLCALAACMESIDVLTHARWVTVLGRDAVTRRFYRTLERLVRDLADTARGDAPASSRREIALLYASRLLFLSFLEVKEWLDGDRAFLARRYDACLGAQGGFQRRVLVPLFFGTLNTPTRSRAPAARALGRVPFLNGGLFARSPLERAYRSLEFSDDALGRFISDLLGRYRFTAHEETSEWSEAAIDPEMLGRAFESLMVGQERRNTGAFFTPHELVARVTDEGLARLVGLSPHDLTSIAERRGSVLAASTAETIQDRLARVHLLDPACGSGAFLVYALERVTSILSALGDPRPVPELRRAVLTRSIFGVDVNPTAVWLCQLRLWLSIVIESAARDPSQVAPLPNLDRHVRVGDALAGHDLPRGAPGNAAVARLRLRYTRAVGARKRTLARALDRAERAAAVAGIDRRIVAIDGSRRDIVVAARGRDLFGGRASVPAATRAALTELRAERRTLLARRRALLGGAAMPFSFAAHFADVAGAGGFDVVVGNPPWVRVHRIPRAVRASLRREYVTYRGAAWRAGAAAAHAGAGFGGQVDLAGLFVERSLAVVAPGGIVALLVPAKLWRSLAGGGLRELLAGQHHVLAFEDWSDAPSLFDAAVYPSLVVVRRGIAPERADHAETSVTVHAARVAATWTVHVRELELDETAGAPWLLLPSPARRAFDALRSAGTPLARSRFGPPTLGVKSGCNGAFLVRLREGGLIASENGATVDVERDMLRPVVRGEHVTRWRIAPNCERLVWTHGPNGRALERLPPRTERWLRGWRRRLMARSDARGTARWWSLFRTEAAAYDVPRVVWADFGRALTAAVLEAGDRSTPLNTCYAVRCADLRDALALSAVLNSPLAAAWLAALAEPARGGYRRYLGWTLSLLPLPAQWDLARDDLATFAELARDGAPRSDAELLQIVVRAYGLRMATVGPLLDWSLR